MIRAIFFAVAMLAAGPLYAHGPTPQRDEQTATISAPAETVWELVGDPARLAEWHPDVESVEMDDNGAKLQRNVTFTGGGSVLDGIDVVDDDAMSIRWRLSEPNPEAIAVSYYTNDISVSATEDGARITWRASFFRADTTNYPDEASDDAAAVKAMKTFISNGLEQLNHLASDSL
jgi:uncharacterized protein YndB with AHSA1/START domain